MTDLLPVALAGFAASMVDGALGMGFGPTSSTILLSTGLSPAAASTTVNLAKVATGLAAGVSHWRFGNIDGRLVLQLAIPGCLGAVVGITVLANVDGNSLRPVLAVMLLLVGLRMLLRFSKRLPLAPDRDDGTGDHGDDHEDGDRSAADDLDLTPPVGGAGVMSAAAAGGVSNGLIGAWGPIVTPYLLHKGMAPRFAIGSVNTAEVFVALASATGLVAAIGKGGIDFQVVAAMLVGGVVAAPIAAWVIKWMPARAMGLSVAALLMVTNLRELTAKSDLGWRVVGLYAVWALLVTAAVFAPRLRSPRGAQATASSVS